MKTASKTLIVALLAGACSLGSPTDPDKDDASKLGLTEGLPVEIDVGSLQDQEGAAGASPQMWLAAAAPHLSAGAPTDFTGMRLHETWATVEGLRLRLLKVYADGPNNKNVSDKSIADWTADPKEIEAAHGFAQSVTGVGRIRAGSYTSATIEMESWYAVKGYAFLPNIMAPQPVSGELTVADPLANPSMTMWTTAAGIVTAPGLVDVTDFTDYDYLEVPLLQAEESKDDSTTPATTRIMTVFDSAVAITEGSAAPRLTLRLDTYHLLLAMDADSYKHRSGISSQEGSGGLAILPRSRLVGFAFLNEPIYRSESYEWAPASSIPDEGELLPPDVGSVDDLWLRYGKPFTMILSRDRVPLRGEIKHWSLFMSIHEAEANADGSYKLLGGGPGWAEDGGTMDYYIDGFRPLAVGDAPIEASCNCIEGTRDGVGDILIRRVSQ